MLAVAESTRAVVASVRSHYETIRPGFLAALLMLMIQFLLGMAVNLFVTIPTDHPGARPSEYFSGVAQS